MRFGYFTLSDNNYPNNPRTPNQTVRDILDQALYAEELGYNSAWIGEHHFSTLGVNSSPELLLAYIAAKTKNIRLAPAVTVLPLHHPVRVAEQWATLDLISGGRVDFATGRGYDKREYIPFGAEFDTNAAVFAEGIDIITRLWNAEGPISHAGKYYRFDEIEVTPMPVQKPMPIYIAAFSTPTIKLAAKYGHNLVVSAGSAAVMHGGMANLARIYDEACEEAGTRPGRKITSTYIHFADTPEQVRAAQERQVRYHQECTSSALPGDRRTAPSSYAYFSNIVDRYAKLTPEHVADSTTLIGNSAQIADVLAEKVALAGFDEVILYFNLGLKPHQQVKDEMARFAAEVAPLFAKTPEPV